MPDFTTSLNRIGEHSTQLEEQMRDLLREIIRDACGAISAAEGSILVPAADREELRFLVSINPALDGSDYTFSCDGSVSGFVFNSSQAIAKVRPENESVSRIDDIAQVDTEFLLAIPIVDDENIHGVATFVNRTGEQKNEPFSAADMRTAQAYGEIYATGLKFFQQVELSADLARADLEENAADLGIREERSGEAGGAGERGGTGGQQGHPREENHQAIRERARLVEIASRLQKGERHLLLGIAGLIADQNLTEPEFAEGDPDLEDEEPDGNGNEGI